MNRTLTWMLLSALAALPAAVGCARQDPEPIARLVSPSLRLDPLPVPRLSAAGLADIAPDHEKTWQAANPRPWKHIVIHHSATDGGNARAFDRAHRGRGWDELGYHFVITNGAGGDDGRIEVGSRWQKQKHGAHTGGTPENEYNELGIGICLVGDFSRAAPSEKQLAALARLVTFLRWRFEIPASRVIGHCEAPQTHTRCPGRALLGHIHAKLANPSAGTVAAGAEPPSSD